MLPSEKNILEREICLLYRPVLEHVQEKEGKSTKKTTIR